MFKFSKKTLGIISISIVAIFTLGYLGYVLSDSDNPTEILPSEVVVEDDFDSAFDGRTVLRENSYASETYTSNLGYRVNDTNYTACVNMGTNDPYTLTDLVIPSIYNDGTSDYTITAIDYSGFVNMTALTTVTFNDSSTITIIDTQAFANDVSLTTFNSTDEGTCTIPANITEIYDSTFLNCSSFTELTFNGELITSIGNNAFNGCIGIDSALLFKYNLLTIGRSSFANCINIPSIMLPGGVTTIGDYAFYADKNVLLFAIPDSVTSVGTNAFRLCEKATAYIGASTKYPTGWPTDNDDNTSSDADWNYATSNYEIDVITDTNNIMATDDYYYTSTWDSTNLIYRITIFKFINTEITELVIPSTLPVLGSVDNVNPLISSSGTEYGVVTNIYGGTYDGTTFSLYGAFGDTSLCENLTDITLPNTLEDVEQYAFVGCTYLNSLTFIDKAEYPSFTLGTDTTTYDMDDYDLTGLTTIEDYGFCIDYENMYDTDYTSDNEVNPPITELVLPTTIESIGYAAFAQWSRIQNLVFTGADDGTSNLQIIYDYAFCNLGHNSSTHVLDLVFPSTLNDSGSDEAIGYRAFYDSECLRSVEFKDGYDTTVTIGYQSFYAAGHLQTVILPDNNTSNNTLNYRAFGSCGVLDWVYIPDSFSTVERHITYGSNDVIFYVEYESDALPSGWNSLWNYYKYRLFSVSSSDDSSNLSSVSILYTKAYYGITSMDTSDEVKTYSSTGIVDNDDNTRVFQYIYNDSDDNGTDDQVIITNYNDNSSTKSVDITIDIMNGYTDLVIGEQSFAVTTDLTAVNIYDRTVLTSIEDYAFAYDYNLATFPYLEVSSDGFTNLTNIGTYAFFRVKLTEVYIGANVATIGDYAFFRMDYLEFFTVDTSNAYYYSDPNHLIGALYSKSGSNYILEYITGLYEGDYAIIDGTIEIKSYAFATVEFSLASGDTSVDITLPTSLVTIDDFAFDAFEVTFASVCGINTISFADPANSQLTTVGEAAFAYQSALTSVTFPTTSTVVTLGDSLFKNCTSLTDVSLPTYMQNSNSEYALSDYMFQYCTSLQTVTLPDNITVISQYAFDGCTSLTSIIANNPTSITEIEQYAFRNCTSYISFDFSTWTELDTIGQYAFYGCTSMTTFTLETDTDVSRIYTYTFYGCTSLTTFNTPGYPSITRIDSYAFDSDAALTTWNFTEMTYLTYIYTYAFYNCTSLTGIDFTDFPALIYIDDYAFNDCDGLTEANFGSNITTIDNYAFFDCDYITEISFGTRASGALVINSYAFANNATGDWTSYYTESYLTSVTFPNYLTYIGNYSFVCQTNITTLDFSSASSVTYIGSYAFQELDSLVLLDLSGCTSTSLTTINSHTFKNCIAATIVTLPPNCQYLSDYSMEGLISMSELNNIDNLISIGNGALLNYKASVINTYTLDFSNNSVLTSIGSRAFEGANSSYCGLTGITFGANTPLQSIGSTAFYKCILLTSLDLSMLTSLSSLGSNFLKESGVTTFIFPTSLSSLTLSANCFDTATYLTTSTSGGSYFEIPSYVTSIPNYCFSNCTSITSLVLPNTITSIGTYIANGTSSSFNIYLSDTYGEYLSGVNANSTWLNNSSANVYFYSSTTPTTSDWTIATADGLDGYWYYSGTTITLWVQ
jgi:hypothetical protein